jgi:DNA-binding CsgD family transcriptional regulator
MGPAFVGRGRQLAELARLRDAAVAGGGSFVLLSGEAGIGKTATLARFAAQAGEAGVPVLAGRAVVEEGAPPFWPWLRVLEQGQDHGLSAALLEMPDALPPAARFLAIERTVQALLAAARPAGLVVILDDLQWADDASLRLLRYLRGDLTGSRLLVVGAAREVTEALAGLQPLVLRLPPLAESDVAAYLASAGEIGGAWPAYVHARTGGNPLFVRELTRVLVQEGLLSGAVTELTVPMELRRMAGTRLEGLGGACLSLLGGASAIGEEFDVATLASAAGMPAGAVADLLAEAVRAGVLVDEPGAPNRLGFAHPLVRDARYGQLPRAERIEWHRRIAGALTGSGHFPAAELARHCVRAAVDRAGHRSAVAACQAAAGAAGRALDFAAAAHWYRKAVELLDGGGYGESERAELLLELAGASYCDGQVSEALRHCANLADLAERLARPDLAARAALVVRGIDGAEPNDVIAALCERARAQLRDAGSSVHAQVLAQHALALTQGGDLGTAGELSRRALAMAERSAEPAALAAALHARQKLVTGPDGVAERLELGARLRDLGAVPGRPEAALWAHQWRIDAAFQLGEMATVDAELAGLVRLVGRLGWPLGRWHLLRVRAVRALLGGQYQEAEELALAAREIASRTQDFTLYRLFYAFIPEVLRRTGRFGAYEPELTQVAQAVAAPIAVAISGHFRLAAGDTGQAATLYERLRPRLATLPIDSRWLAVVTAGAELATHFGDQETTALCYRMLLPHAAYYVASAAGYRGTVTRTLGIIAGALGDHNAADRHLSEAEAMESRIGAPGDLAIAQLAHARALATRGGPGDRARAVTLAEQCIHTARRLGMAPALADATRLADKLTGVRAGGLTLLTPRERQIAALVADGLANRAIADALVLSERTVETHVRNLLTKLGLANRTQVAAWALRAGLRTGTAYPH